ncbi:MAG: hypothetical protein JW990_21230 [Thermoleophilia bacterium]|nr:hypothetical protein [Thermoleophilia bacterium]
MSEVTIYPYLSGYDGYKEVYSDAKSTSLVYAWQNARAGSGTLAQGSYPWIGTCYYYFAPVHQWRVYQMGMEFDLSALPSTLKVDDVDLYLAAEDGGLSAWVVECIAYDFGATWGYGVADWIPGDSLGNYTRLAYVGADTLVADTPVAMTLDGTNLLDLIETDAARAALGYKLRIVFYPQEQKSGTAPSPWGHMVLDTSGSYPTWAQTSKLVLTCHHEVVTLAQAGARAKLGSSIIPTLAQAEARCICRYRSKSTVPTVNSVRAFSPSREFRGILPGQVTVTEKLDGADTISVMLPWRYNKIDGTTDERTSMITGGWYVEYRGHWYRVQDFKPEKYKNQFPVQGLSAEVDLERHYTNYASSAFSMPSHTPTEIMEAVLSGQPEHDWYNGDFATLDAEGFPVGWIEETGTWESVSTGTPYIKATAFDDGEAELDSWGLNHTAGAQIKSLCQFWVGAGFSGSVTLVLSWTNAAGVQSTSEEIPLDYDRDETWISFEAGSWYDVLNEKCVLKLKVEDNPGGVEVRFRGVRFRQNESATGWTYIGSLDARTPDVPYNDPAFQMYGGWTLDAINEVVYSETAEDVLGRVFSGDQVTVNFAAGGAGAKADILVDGEAKVTGLSVAAATSYAVAGLNKHRSHVIEVIVNAVKVSVSGFTLSTENRIAVNWNGLSVMEALRELKKLVGGEYLFDTVELRIYHDATQGYDLTASDIGWLREGVNLVSFVPMTQIGEIQNLGYVRGAGDAPFQLSVKMASTGTDDSGNTSEDLYETQRFLHINKDIRDRASLVAEAMAIVEEKAFPQVSYQATALNQDAEYFHAGDSVQVTQELVGTDDLRILELTRKSSSPETTILMGDRIKTYSPASHSEEIRRQVQRLLRAS